MNPGYFVLLTIVLMFVGTFAFGCALFSTGGKPENLNKRLAAD